MKDTMERLKKYGKILAISIGICLLSYGLLFLAFPDADKVKLADLRAKQAQLDLQEKTQSEQKNQLESQIKRLTSQLTIVKTALEAIFKEKSDISIQIDKLIIPTANASPFSPVSNEKKLQALFDKVGSPLNANHYYTICHLVGLDDRACNTYAGIMYAESRFCTDRATWIEIRYSNCTGYKSVEIMKTHKPDKNGSWLYDFHGDYGMFYEVTLKSFKKNYWDIGLTTPDRVMSKWVGHASKGYLQSVNSILDQLK